MIKISELVEGFTDPEGDYLLPVEFWTDYGYQEVVEEGLISIPLAKDLFIKAELVEILDNNDAIVKLTFPEDTPIGSFELNWSVTDVPGNNYPVNTSQIINIVPEGYQDPGIDPIKRPTPINLGSNNTKLFTDINSGELLFADSSNSDNQTLLKNKDGSSFLANTSLTAVDIEQDSSGDIKLLSYREAGNLSQKQLQKLSAKELRLAENINMLMRKLPEKLQNLQRPVLFLLPLILLVI